MTSENKSRSTGNQSRLRQLEIALACLCGIGIIISVVWMIRIW